MPWPKGVPRSDASKAKTSASLRARHNQYMKEWQARNPEKAAYWKLKGQQRVRRDLIEAMGGKCVRCGFCDWRAFQIDHTNGDGRNDPHRYGSRYAYSKIVKANPDKYQLLCANCNWIKRYETGEHGAKMTDRLLPATTED